MKKQQNTNGFYVVDANDIPDVDWDSLTNDEFINYANEFMTETFFCMAFNNGDLSTETQIIRYI